MIRVCPLSALPPGEALRVQAEPPIAVFHTAVTIEQGSVEGCDVLAVYRRGEEPVAVLGNASRPSSGVGAISSTLPPCRPERTR